MLFISLHFFEPGHQELSVWRHLSQTLHVMTSQKQILRDKTVNEPEFCFDRRVSRYLNEPARGFYRTPPPLSYRDYRLCRSLPGRDLYIALKNVEQNHNSVVWLKFCISSPEVIQPIDRLNHLAYPRSYRIKHPWSLIPYPWNRTFRVDEDVGSHHIQHILCISTQRGDSFHLCSCIVCSQNSSSAWTEQGRPRSRVQVYYPLPVIVRISCLVGLHECLWPWTTWGSLEEKHSIGFLLGRLTIIRRPLWKVWQWSVLADSRQSFTCSVRSPADETCMCTLRERYHNFVLPDNSFTLLNCNFINRILYKNTNVVTVK